MKKAFTWFVLVLICIVLSGFFAHAEYEHLRQSNRELSDISDWNDLLKQVYSANTGDALRSKHSSLLITALDKEGSEHLVYLDRNIKLIEKDSALFSGYRVNNYILKDDGSFCRFISFDDEGDRWQVLSPDILLETVANLESVGETLVLTVTAVKDWDSEYYTTDADIRTILTIDARTLEIISVKETALFQDGKEEIYRATTIEYGANRPDCDVYPSLSSLLFEHLYNKEAFQSVTMRTVSYIFDADTAYERQVSYSVPVGDGIVLRSMIVNGTEYYIDENRSIPDNEYKDNDAVYYLTDEQTRTIDMRAEMGEEQPIETASFRITSDYDVMYFFPERYRSYLSADIYLNDSKPIKTLDELKAAGLELYLVFADAGKKPFRDGTYNHMFAELSKNDKLILFDFGTVNTLGGDIMVLVDATNGKVICYSLGE